MKYKPATIDDIQQHLSHMARREFIKRSAAVGLAFGLPPFLLSCGNTRDVPPRTETRTLFFNMAHENNSGDTYFLVAGGHTYPLISVSAAPQVLAKARTTNNFLRTTSDEQITHHVEDLVFANDSVTLCYVGNTINGQMGAWSLSMIYLHIPNSGTDYAFNAASGNVPLSNKRATYHQPAAQSAQDLRDENALIDTHDHAASLIMLHPSLLSAEPNSAHYIYTNHVGAGILTKKLAITLQNLGPAQPQQSPNQPNPTGWATMQPLLDQKNAPIFNPNSGLIQYFPDWHPSIDLAAAPTMVFHINGTRNDPNLGATIVRGKTNQPDDISGKIWFQREGFTTVDPSSSKVAASTGDNISVKILDHSPEQGLDITTSASGAGTTINIALSNSFLRYLGIYLQFLDEKHQVIPLKSIASYPDGIQSDHDTLLDNLTSNEMFLDMVSPELTILGIPVAAGTDTISINVPPEARLVKVLASGAHFGVGAPHTHPNTEFPGIAMTVLVNYGLTMVFMAAGAASASASLSGFIRTLGIALVDDVINLIDTVISNGEELSTAQGWEKLAITLGKLIGKSSAVSAGKILLSLVEYVIGIVGPEAAANGVPIIGQIQRALSCIVGVVDMTHTSIDLAQSPWTYVTELVLTHDLSVTLLPDPNNGNGFPAAANQYKVTAMFESGTPYVQTFPINNAGSTLPPVIFKSVPLGGQANVSVAFVQQGADDILLGKGTTGLIDNNATAHPTITIEELRFPINSNTFYQHQQKTMLAINPQGGAPVHVWTSTKIAPTATAADLDAGNQPGDLSVLESITVRQATSQPPVNGYIGYSWRAFSSGVADCSSGAVAQLDQVVNLNSLTAQAQTGYVANRCGLPSGVKVAYSLLSHDTTNFYLDTSFIPGTSVQRNLIRRIQLDPTPGFDDPNSNLAWGKLNFASTALLLHPAGKIVSISVTDHQIETLTLPDAAASDDQASSQLVAIRHGGQGNLPGLLSAPTAAAISPDGVLLVLEQGNNRIQAFDVNGNPVSYFTKQSEPYFLNLTATTSGDTQYLDLAVEYTGFMYVLSFNQASQRYQMDIYHPTQTGTTPICTTFDMNAGRLTVDFWRNVYTLNFEVLQLNGAFPTVTEPSVSLWTPCVVGNAC